MPRIELIDPVLFAPNDPIHWEIDNLPLKSLVQRQELINFALDNALEQMRDAIGTAGSMANRLNQSIEPDGSLKTAAIDDAAHSIEEHTDSDDYVRMLKTESDKLAGITDGATDLEIYINSDGSSVVKIIGGILHINASSSVNPIVTGPNILTFDLALPEEAAHQHFYAQTPILTDPTPGPEDKEYKVNGASTPYIDESLRVKINGVEIYEGSSVYVPGNLVDDSWMLLNFTSDSTAGTFELSAAISDDDVIKVDYDISFI